MLAAFIFIGAMIVVVAAFPKLLGKKPYQPGRDSGGCDIGGDCGGDGD